MKFLVLVILSMLQIKDTHKISRFFFLCQYVWIDTRTVLSGFGTDFSVNSRPKIGTTAAGLAMAGVLRIEFPKLIDTLW